MLNIAKELRNKCAHGNAVFDFKSSVSVKGDFFKNAKRYKKQSLLYSIYVISFLLQSVINLETNTMNYSIEFLNEIQQVFDKEEYSSIKEILKAPSYKSI